MKQPLLIILSFFASISFYGQGIISGEIKDENTEEPIPYANLVIKAGENIITG